LTIRLATDDDKDSIWVILEPMIRRGDSYTLPRDMTKGQALEFWFAPGNETFVWQDSSAILGTYFLRANQRGGGSHVANCGYVTAAGAEGRGIARAMCLHSLQRARERGFRPCNLILWLAATNVRPNSGGILASKWSAGCPARLIIQNTDSSTRW
jgi:hypothetical protein